MIWLIFNFGCDSPVGIQIKFQIGQISELDSNLKGTSRGPIQEFVTEEPDQFLPYKCFKHVCHKQLCSPSVLHIGVGVSVVQPKMCHHSTGECVRGFGNPLRQLSGHIVAQKLACHQDTPFLPVMLTIFRE